MKPFYLTVCVIAIALSNCASTYQEKTKSEESKMQVWLNHHQSELIRELGPPDNTADDGQGGKILIYGKEEVVWHSSARGHVYENGNVTYRPAHDYTETKLRMFYVNKEGIIYYCKYKEE